MAAAASAAAVFTEDFEASESVAEIESGDEQGLDLDLDLDDLDLDDLPASVSAESDESVPASGGELALDGLDDLELDLDIGGDTLEESFGFKPDAISSSSFGDSAAVEAPAEKEIRSEHDLASFTSTADDLTFDLGEEELDLDLDEEELDLELNEDDLNFALNAMDGTSVGSDSVETANSFAPVPVELESANRFNPEFNESSDADELELDNLADITDSDFNSTPGLSDFDLSFSSSDLGSKESDLTSAADDLMSEDLKAMEADLGSLSDLESLEIDLDGAKELDDLADFNFELDTAAPTLDGADEITTFAELDREPAAETPVAVVSSTDSAASGDEFDFLADTDEVATKLDLARAYIDMGDTDGAKDILDEVLQEGSDEQQQEASELLGRIA